MSRARVLPVMVAVGLAALVACSSTRVVRVPLEARLDERESPPAAMVSRLRVALWRPAVSNDPDQNVGLTSDEAESYPTATHQAVAVPQALREVGFDVVEILRPEDARGVGADYVLELKPPEVQAFHPAQGARITLEGSAYDIHVKYSGAIKGKDLAPLGVVEGHGHDSRRFRFMEPLAKAAFMGLATSVATFGASIFALAAVAYLGALANVAGAGSDLFGACKDPVRLGPNGRGPALPTPVCITLENLLINGAFGIAVSLVTALSGGLAGALAENVYDVFLAGAHLSLVDPAWKRTVKYAHDGAARALADRLAVRVLEERGRVVPGQDAPAPAPAAVPVPVPYVPPPADPAPAAAPK
ncbi:MAG: hypothetical protein HY904_10975 [Deltaproteobacteria bacterium]|nr:hypothetical protein [Deltaproteobacteria bacterium]